jgi:putative (di)nucleoside polyphosphate hydrolase|tara:strand:+ start:1048 stop:1563 length:516 start_codon:yes stop_codon:yes gene_type:complete
MNYSDAQIENLKMRKAVGIILIRNDGFVWTGKRKLGPGVRPGEYNLWQMPQGGIDEGEKPKDAAFRELEEETGSKSAEILFEFEDWLEYRLPSELIGKVLKGFKGQKQKWFLMKFNGTDEEFNLNNHTPEFDEWCWRDLKTMPDLVVDFKKPLYQKLLEIFSKEIEKYKIS